MLRSTGSPAETLAEIDRTLDEISRLQPNETAGTFFDALATYLAGTLGISHVLVGEIEEGNQSIRTLALHADGSVAPNISYPLAGTPCAHVVGSKMCFYPSGIQQVFPRDEMLRELGLNAYMGTPLFDSVGRTIGILAALSRSQFARPEEAKIIFRICAIRASAELERAQAERARRTAEGGFQALFQYAPDAMLILGFENGLVRQANRQFEVLTGSAAEALQGHPLESVAAWEDPRAMADLLDAIRQGGETHEREIRMKDANGRLRDILTSAARVDAITGRSLLLAFKDITDHKHAERMEAVRHLAGGIAHQFNNLLMIIQGTTEMMMRRTLPYAANADLEQIQKTCSYAATLTERLLNFSTLAPKPADVVDLNQQLHYAHSRLAHTVRPGIRLECRTAAEAALIRIASNELQEIIAELVATAQSSMTIDGTIQMSALLVRNYGSDLPQSEIPPGDYVDLCVAASHKGMEDKVHPSIFEPFSTSITGDSLALPAAYGMIKRVRGFATVSTKPEEGLRLDVFFPQEKPAHAAQTPGEQPSGSVPGQGTILLVEDEALLRTIASEFLAESGYTVLVAANGQEAVTAAEKHAGSVDLLLTDVIMPGMNGRQLAEILTGRWPALKVLFMSGYTPPDKLATSLPNVVGILRKPFSLAALNSKVQACLGS